jgi:hypothetical protein
MANQDTARLPGQKVRAKEAHVENVHGHEVKVTREDDPSVPNQDELKDEKLRDQDVVVDAEGEYVQDELGNITFVPYPRPVSRAG